MKCTSYLSYKHGFMYVIVNTLQRKDKEQRNSGHKSNSWVMQSENPSICTFSTKPAQTIPQSLTKDLLIYSYIKYAN
jgi:hypothetical protein